MKPKAHIVSNALSAAAIGVLQLGVAISLAALIFSGPLSAGAGRAAAGFLIGTAIVSLIVGMSSKMTIAIAGAQDTPAIMLVAVAATITSSPDIRPDELVPTIIMLIAITGIATGLAFLILAHFGLTSFVRFLPFPVVSGFTAGTGWLLFRGGVEVMHGTALEFGDVPDLFSWSQAQFLVPGLVLALIMLVVVSVDRLPNTLVSVAILGGALVIHIVGRAASSLQQLKDDGWLVGPFTQDQGWVPITPSDFRDTDWGSLFDNSLLIVAVVAVSVIGLLLNLSGLEGEPDPHIDMNTEVRAAGVANLLTGFCSGLVGYHLLGDTVLGRRLGARGRFVPIVIAVLAVVTVLIGPDLIALVPRAIAGGTLAGLGVTLLISWATTSLRQMNASDQFLSVLILVVIAIFGVLPGVGAGVIVAAAIFIVKYSRTNPVRHVIDAAGRSTVDRDQRDQLILSNSTAAILAYELQGYLFFGSTTSIQRQIDARVVDPGTQFIIVDFARVTGVDSTATSGLAAINNQLRLRNVTMVLSGLRPAIARELDRDDLDVEAAHTDLDHAIAWCEDDIITARALAASQDNEARAPFEPSVMDALALPIVDVDAGDVLIEAGATDSDVYFVEEGQLTAWLPTEGGRRIRIRRVLPGAALGEIAFCTGAPRSATVIADTEAVIRVLTRERFDELVATDPDAAIAVQQELLRRLSVRVSSTSAMVRDLLQ